MFGMANTMSFPLPPKKKDSEEKDDPNVSPFQKYADEEGFILVYVERSYMLLSSINNSIPNYYTMLEVQARQSPQMAKELYISLREGMELTPQQFALVHCSKPVIDL